MIRLGSVVFLITFFAILLQSVFLFVDDFDELTAIPLILIFGGIAAFFINRYGGEDADFQLGIFFWAFSVRLWMGMLMYGWGFKDLFGDEDASGYVTGWGMAQNWYVNGFDGFVSDIFRVLFERQNEGQALIWAIPSFFAGGESRMIVSVMNCFAGALLVVIVYQMARRVFDSSTARIAAVLVTFWMSHILLSATTAKEILVIFFEWVILFLLIRDTKGFSIRDGLLAVPAFLAVFIMRFYAVYMLLAAAFFRFILGSRQNLLRNALFGTAVVASLFIFLSSSGLITRDFERIERISNSVEGWREGVSSTTGSGIEVYSQFETPSVAIPVATVYFFFAPFPWEAFSGTARNAFGAVENIFIIAMLILGFPAIKIFFKDKFVELAPVFAFCTLYAGMHIWGLSNVGLAWRHKQTVMPLIFMLVAVAITQRRAAWNFITSRQQGRERKLTVIKAS